MKKQLCIHAYIHTLICTHIYRYTHTSSLCVHVWSLYLCVLLIREVSLQSSVLAQSRCLDPGAALPRDLAKCRRAVETPCRVR